jgi:hypothetical protein
VALATLWLLHQTASSWLICLEALGNTGEGNLDVIAGTGIKSSNTGKRSDQVPRGA